MNPHDRRRLDNMQQTLEQQPTQPAYVFMGLNPDTLDDVDDLRILAKFMIRFMVNNDRNLPLTTSLLGWIHE